MLELTVAAVVVGTFAALSFGRWYLERRDARRRRAALAAAFEACARDIGAALIPAFRETARVLADAAVAFRAYGEAFDGR
jgi:hypothetical protein